MPAPELIDVAPLEEKPRRQGKSGNNTAGRDDHDHAARPRMKVGIADSETRDEGRKAARGRGASELHREERDERDHRPARDADRDFNSAGRRDRDDRDTGYADDDDDSLFDNASNEKTRAKQEDRSGDRSYRRETPREDDRSEPAGKGWRKGRQFIVEDDDAEGVDRRPFFARKRKDEPRDDRESLRFADDDHDGAHENHERGDTRDEAYDNAYIVDADWEDVEDASGEHSRGFGRKIRAERRRATALARMEDVRPLDPAALDDEFFAALKVTPRELERAIRKARRRAEAREKNRLTPLRVIGWAAWVAVIVGVAYGGFIYRNEIVKMAPKAADAYAVIGIDANPYGLSIENVRHRLAMSTGGPTIEITGNLRNETDGTVTAPLLQAEALGPRGELLARWTFTASQTDVAQGEMADFITRAPAPEGVAEVALSFAPEKSVLESLMPGAR